MAFVIKVSYASALRRLTLRKEDVGDEGIPFASLESRIRELLQLPANSRLLMTYTDAEGDVVTMANDQDVHDALFQQKLNPLRVSVSVDASKAASPAAMPNASAAAAAAAPAAALAAGAGAAADVDVTIKQVLSKLSNPEIRKVLQSYEPLIEKVASPTQASAFLESLLRNVATQVATVVKHGADVATSAASPFGFSSPSQSSGTLGGSSASTPSSKTSETFAAAVAEAQAAKPEAAGKQKADVDSVVHSGVSCDLCEMNPIVGPRYKATKKFNYDLCAGCYEKCGKEEDFQRIETSMFRPRHLHGAGPHRGTGFQPLGHPGFHGRPFGMRGPPFGRHHCYMPPGAAPAVGKLDSRFVCDVTMFDGTEVAPKTNFTKIWRLRNSGAISWPEGTNLVHVGGDELGQVSMVPLEIPPQGLAAEGEMEVAVDMVAPEKPGRYVSHWRLASPAGPKFGHRIWVVIQVVAPPTGEDVEQTDVADSSDKNSALTVEEPVAEPTAESAHGDESTVGAAEAESADASVTSVVNIVEPTATHAEENVVEEAGSDAQEEVLVASEADAGEDFAMVDIESAVSVEKIADTEHQVSEVQKSDMLDSKADVEKGEAVDVDESRITYPKLDIVDEGPITYPVVQSPSPVTPESEEPAASEVAEYGKTLRNALAKLQTMGFSNTKLNLELLEKNNLDLRLTLNDLCAVEEWDPILEELEEMGFYDVDVNRRLMFKNNGSVKRVVKELVQMYRNLQDKGKTVEKTE